MSTHVLLCPLLAAHGRLLMAVSEELVVGFLMTHRSEDTLLEAAKHPLVVRVTDDDFQREVLEKLTRLEAKMDMLVGGTQPGRMRIAEQKIERLERNDVRRGVYDRLVNAMITVTISVVIALHDKWWK